MRRALYVGFAFFLSVTLIGCGGSGERVVRVKGAVVGPKGHAIGPKDGEAMTVLFLYKSRGEQRTASGPVAADGTFEVSNAPADTEVMVHLSYAEPKRGTSPKVRLGGDFSDAGPAKMTYRVPPASGQEILIDLKKKVVTAKG
jgi:hypothetical protein